MATKSVSTFAIFFVLFLVISEKVVETEAQDSECLKEYGGDVDFLFCSALIYPSFCYRNCRAIKGAKGGICRAEADGVTVKCLCDFCGDNSGSDLNDRYTF